MCTVVAVFHESRLIIGANRDEFYARPALPPSELEPGIFGGRDEQAHGTWLGVTRAALFVAVTNQRTMRPPDRSKQSRGALVLEALRQPDAQSVARLLATLDGRDYNPFNLLFGDGRALYVAYAREQRELVVEPVERGVTVLANDRIDAPDYPKTQRARALLDVGRPIESLKSLLTDHVFPEEGVLPPLQALCIHTPTYGTRSSALVELSPGRVHRYEHAEGAPCTHPFVDYTPLIAATS